MSELIAQPYLAGGVDCIDLVKMIPSVLKTLRQSTFTSQHAACTAVPKYTVGIGVGNWGSENFKLFMLLDMISQPLVWNCSHTAREPSGSRVAIGQSSRSGLFMTINRFRS